MPIIKERNGYYYADLRSEGGGRPSLKTKNKREAEKRYQQKLSELGQSREAATFAQFDITIHQAIRLKKPGTQDAYRSKAAQLFRWFAPTSNAYAIERTDVEQYIGDRLDEGVKRHTVHKELVVLRQALKRIDRVHVVPQFDANYVPCDRWLKLSEFSALLNAAAPSRRLWLILSVYQGANGGELRRLKWQHVDLESDTIIIPGDKRETRRRIIPLHPIARKWIEGVDRDGPLLSDWQHGNRYRDMKRFCERAGIDYVNFNDLRRTFASWLKQQGVDSLTVSQLMGHASTHMVDRVYGKLDAPALKAALYRLPAEMPTLRAV